ncbi:nuclear RNA export factor 1, partial [Clarias magur]
MTIVSDPGVEGRAGDLSEPLSTASRFQSRDIAEVMEEEAEAGGLVPDRGLRMMTVMSQCRMTFTMGDCNGDLILTGVPKIDVTVEEEEKIQEIPHGKKYEKQWLLSSLRNICTVPFCAVQYHTEGNRAQFYIEDSTTAYALSKLSRRITDKDGFKVAVLLNQCQAPSLPQQDLKLEDLEHLKQCMSKRFDGSQQALDLNNIRVDPDLVSLNIEVALGRKNSMQAVIKIIEENIPE